MRNKFAYGNHGHTSFIVELCKSINCQTYLELGTYNCFNISRVATVVPHVIGVDLVSNREYDYVGEFHEMGTDEYLDQLSHNVDVCFIDACHNFEAVKKDFKGVLAHLNTFGVIILHDTSPAEERLLESGYCSNSYMMVDWLREEHQELDAVTLDISEAGLTIVKRHNDKRTNKFIK